MHIPDELVLDRDSRHQRYCSCWLHPRHKLAAAAMSSSYIRTVRLRGSAQTTLGKLLGYESCIENESCTRRGWCACTELPRSPRRSSRDAPASVRCRCAARSRLHLHSLALSSQLERPSGTVTHSAHTRQTLLWRKVTPHPSSKPELLYHDSHTDHSPHSHCRTMHHILSKRRPLATSITSGSASFRFVHAGGCARSVPPCVASRLLSAVVVGAYARSLPVGSRVA